MVAVIAEALAVRRGQRILDVGTGSGYQAAVLAELGAEVRDDRADPELAEQARANLAAAGYERRRGASSATGLSAGPSARPTTGSRSRRPRRRVPETLYEQLAPGGRLVVPVGGRAAQRLEVIVRSPEGPAVLHSVPCRFVPLVGEEGYDE